MVLFGFLLLPAGKPGRDEIENTTPTITIIPIITDIVATNLTEGISSLHSILSSSNHHVIRPYSAKKFHHVVTVTTYFN